MNGFRCGRQPVNQYSHIHHLSRSVCCVWCQTSVLKDVDFVRRGSRCLACWLRFCQSGSSCQ